MSTPETLYQRAGILLSDVPNFERQGTLSDVEDQWLAAAIAVIESASKIVTVPDVLEIFDAKYAAKVVVSQTTNAYLRATNARALISVLRRVLGRLELQVQTEIVGAYVPAGDVDEAYKAVGDVLKTAANDILLVDPFADETILNAYADLAPDHIIVRILTDPDRYKPTLKTAHELWKRKYRDKRPLDVRLAKAPLHDRLIILDGERAWTVTQSFKDLAATHPATIVSTPNEIADLKIKAYQNIWGDAFAMA
ncbi:MAG: hypothetical protein WBV18_01230 [Methyloceanibacter sp.]|jgi:hypothetical protein|uniref:hypothetical protein n=1 Tax=Methyloceanibacter sp. TaxID=1965321 RepID=UPI003C35126C